MGSGVGTPPEPPGRPNHPVVPFAGFDRVGEPSEVIRGHGFGAVVCFVRIGGFRHRVVCTTLGDVPEYGAYRAIRTS